MWSQPAFAWRMLPQYFTTDVWSHVAAARSNYYRPLFMVWLLLNAKLFGLQTVFWHLSAILFHLAATLLFYFLARRLLGDAGAAGVAAMLFGIHPVHVEAVAWISGATESMYAILAFGMILCHLRWRESPAAAGFWRIASLALFALALWTKETAIVLPLLLFGYEWLFPSDTADTPVKRLGSGLKLLLPHAAVVLLYLAFRLHALRSMSPVSGLWTPAMMLETWPSVLSFYIGQLLMPVQFSLYYPNSPVTRLLSPDFVMPLVVVAVATLALLVVSRVSRLAAFASLLLVIPVLPVLYLRAFRLDDFVHDRYLYVPVTGFCILLAMGWQRLGNGLLRQVVLAAVCIVFAGSTLRASRIWENNLTLYTHGVELAPENALAELYLGDELASRGRFADALPPLKRALAVDQFTYPLYIDIAWCYTELGDDAQASQYLHDAIQLEPRKPEAYRRLAIVDWRRSRLDQAEADLRHALALPRGIGPPWWGYHALLGSVLERKGDLKGALAEFQAELRENPDDDDVRHGVRLVSAKLGLSAP